MLSWSWHTRLTPEKHEDSCFYTLQTNFIPLTKALFVIFLQELMAEAEAELARVDERMGDGANPAPPTVHVRRRRIFHAEWLLRAFCSICPTPDTVYRELHGSPAHSACAAVSTLCLGRVGS